MKKALSLLLVLVMCLSFVAIPASAAGKYIQFPKNQFDPNDEIVYKVAGLTDDMIEPLRAGFTDGRTDDLTIGLFRVDTPDGNWSSAVWADLVSTYWQKGTGTTRDIYRQAPAEPGTYVVKLYYYWSEEVIDRLTITVGGVQREGSIALDKTAYTALGKMTVTATGITAQMVTTMAFAGIFEKGEGHHSGSSGHYDWDYLPAGNSTREFRIPNKNGEFEVRLYTTTGNENAQTLVMSVPFTVSGATGSAWAQGELEKANELGLIPDSLKGADLTKPITRAEFAAVAVKVFENLSGTKTTPSAANTFTDTKDSEVLKAHNTGLMVGVSDDKFDPNALLNREQAATALTRVLKRAYIPGWTFATDGQFTLNFTKPAAFADDADISAWAKDSVYFMAANELIKGIGDNKFAPKATTTAQQAAGYASATREQAIIIGMRLVENLKGKPVDYTQG